MVPPSMAELKARLIGRGTETEEVICRRLRRAMEELELARSYDRLIVNDTVEACVDRLDAMIYRGEGLRPGETDLLDRLKAEGEKLFRKNLRKM